MYADNDHSEKFPFRNFVAKMETCAKISCHSCLLICRFQSYNMREIIPHRQPSSEFVSETNLIREPKTQKRQIKYFN